MAVGKDMLWLGSVDALNARGRTQYVLAQERIDKEYAGTFDRAVNEFCRYLTIAHHEGVAYFSIEKQEDKWYVKGYPVKKKYC